MLLLDGLHYQIMKEIIILMNKKISKNEEEIAQQEFKELSKVLLDPSKKDIARKKSSFLVKKYPNHIGLSQAYATILTSDGDYIQSNSILKSIIDKKEDNEYTHYFLLVNSAKENNLPKIIESYVNSIKKNKNFIEIYKIFFNTLNSIKIDDYSLLTSEEVKSGIAYAIQNNFIPIQDIKRIIQEILICDIQKHLKEKNFDEFINKVNSLQSLEKNKEISFILKKYITNENINLLNIFLRETTITNHYLEVLLTLFRSFIFKNYNQETKNLDENKNIRSLLLSIFLQNNLNSYIWLIDDEEKSLIHKTSKKVKDKINLKKNINQSEFLLLGSYFNLKEEKIFLNYLNKKIRKENKQFYKEISKPLTNLSENKELLKKINIGKKITNKKSLEIASYYNKNFSMPWDKISTVGEVSFLDFLKINIRPIELLGDKKFTDNPSILYVGCGSGRDALIINTIKNSKIDIIDLSIENLLYTQKKCTEHNIKNVDIYHLDFLDIKTLGKKYDIIFIDKVLNQLDNFYYGFNLLLDILNDGGYAKILLESPIANLKNQRIINEIKSLKNENLEDDISNIRRKVLKNENKNLKDLLTSDNFYNKRSFQKMLNPQHKSLIGIEKIKNLIDENDLEFVGWGDFIKNRTLKEAVMNFYSKNFKDDFFMKNLDNWNELEKKNPIIFSHMYKFWIRKKLNKGA